MEKMGDIVGALQAVLGTELLAKSWNELALKLGTGRNSFYRIMNGEANETAIENLLSLLEKQLNVDGHMLLQMEAAISNANEFTKLMNTEMNLDYRDWQFQTILAFIAHDYSHFSPQFRDGMLKNILNLERTDPKAFFNMLAYFYITSKDIRFYKKNKSHKERAATVIEPLGKRLMSIYPSNGLGAGMSFLYSKSDILNAESQTLWSVVGTISSMLQAFASPLETAEQDCNYLTLPGIAKRSYWRGNNPDKTILLWLRPGKEPATGHYELFCIDRQTGALKGIASLFLLNADIISIFIKSPVNSQLGLYLLEDDTLIFEWEKPDDDPIKTGNKWTLLPLSNSQSLRELDRSITDDALLREMARSEGFDYDFAMQPADIIISKKSLQLLLKNGRRYSLDISSAPFLSKLTPAEPLMVLRQISDDRIFAVWPQIRQSYPLNLFTEL